MTDVWLTEKLEMGYRRVSVGTSLNYDTEKLEPKQNYVQLQRSRFDPFLPSLI